MVKSLPSSFNAEALSSEHLLGEEGSDATQQVFPLPHNAIGKLYLEKKRIFIRGSAVLWAHKVLFGERTLSKRIGCCSSSPKRKTRK